MVLLKRKNAKINLIIIIISLYFKKINYAIWRKSDQKIVLVVQIASEADKKVTKSTLLFMNYTIPP